MLLYVFSNFKNVVTQVRNNIFIAFRNLLLIYKDMLKLWPRLCRRTHSWDIIVDKQETSNLNAKNSNTESCA